MNNLPTCLEFRFNNHRIRLVRTLHDFYWVLPDLCKAFSLNLFQGNSECDIEQGLENAGVDYYNWTVKKIRTKRGVTRTVLVNALGVQQAIALCDNLELIADFERWLVKEFGEPENQLQAQQVEHTPDEWLQVA
ncbi:MAG: hypothetical protein LDL41_01815 [Coleofasciculus sp. S288]|nr:hypothetical protein [Coleofasciculus sp. S288]